MRRRMLNSAVSGALLVVACILLWSMLDTTRHDHIPVLSQIFALIGLVVGIPAAWLGGITLYDILADNDIDHDFSRKLCMVMFAVCVLSWVGIVVPRALA